MRRTEGFAGTTSTAASSTAAPLDQAETAAARAWLADTLIGRQALLIVDTNKQVARLSAQLHADLPARPHRRPGRRGAIRGAKWGHLGWL
jgi:hypothetical protein